MVENPYSVLGVARDVADDAIRRSYLKLVKELHPDVNPTPEAEERFKRISAAYDIIGEPEKRRQYDNGEIDAAGDPIRRAWRPPGDGHRGGHFDGTRPGGLGDIFSDMFSGAPGSPGFGQGAGYARRGRDLRYTLDVSFLEAALGAKKRVTLPEGGVLDLSVPAGVNEGQVLRLKGKGAPGFANGAPGDALVGIKVGGHPQFKRVGNDVHIEVPITIDEAVLGAKIEVATLAGRVNLQIPKGTSSGKTFRLREQGIKLAASGKAGDQLVVVRIVLPESIDDSLSQFISEWRQKNRYDAGRR